MKEVVRISLAGVSFALDTEAYNTVKNYLNEISGHYSNDPSRDEILNDIEERISEIFLERAGRESVVTEAMVEYAIGILGRPSEIFSDGQDSEKSSEKRSGDEARIKRKLFRDYDNSKLGGVCAGMAAYFDVDIVWVRLAWVAATLLSMVGTGPGCGFVLFCYLILWIVMPGARTVEQRYSMYGNSNAFDYFEQRNACNKRRRSGASRLFKRAMGLMLFVIAIGWLCVALIAYMTGAISLSLLFSLAMVTVPVWVLSLVAVMVFFLPPIGILYGSVMLLFDIKSPSWHPGLIIFLLWVVSAIAFAAIYAMPFIAHQVHVLPW